MVGVKPQRVDGATDRFRMRRDAFGLMVGGGQRQLLRGTLLEGRIVRRNETFRRVVIDTDQGMFTLNEEDVEPADNIN